MSETDQEERHVYQSVNSTQATLRGHTPYSNCRNDTAGSGFIHSSASYLFRLQGRDDFSSLPRPSTASL